VPETTVVHDQHGNATCSKCGASTAAVLLLPGGGSDAEGFIDAGRCLHVPVGTVNLTPGSDGRPVAFCSGCGTTLRYERIG